MISAPETAAPLESVTNPVTWPLEDCASALWFATRNPHKPTNESSIENKHANLRFPDLCIFMTSGSIGRTTAVYAPRSRGTRFYVQGVWNEQLLSCYPKERFFCRLTSSY